MDLGGDRGTTPLVEEPRRPPWKWIVAAAAALAVAFWAASNVYVEVIALDPEPLTTRPPEALSNATARDTPAAAPAMRSAGPRWLRQPIPHYPSTGLPAGRGDVTLNCGVQGDRTLGDCRVLRESPEGYGFGRSAVEAAQRSTVTPDSPIGVRVQFTIRYRLPEGPGPDQSK